MRSHHATNEVPSETLRGALCADRRGQLQKRASRYAKAAALAAGLILAHAPAHASGPVYNVYLSTAVTNQSSFGAQFLANVTNYYLTNVVPSSFFANTWTLTLVGINPKYVPTTAPTAVTFDTTTFENDLHDMIDNSSMTYLNGWVDGQQYERGAELKNIGTFDIQCSSPTDFTLIQRSTGTWDLGTCEDALGTISDFIYTQNFSTPTVVPGF